MTDCLLAIDLGSTSLKAQVYDPTGRTLAAAARPTVKVRPPDGRPGWVVWDPQQIWADTTAAVRQAVGQLEPACRVRAVSVTGMGMDGLPVDRQGRELYPFISWHDDRTTEQARWWKRHIGAERTFAITGFPPWPILAVMRMLWLVEHEPQVMARAQTWLLIEDWMNWRLCGEKATDYSMASCTGLWDQRRRCWSEQLVEAAGIDGRWLPPARPSGTVLGTLTAQAAQATALDRQTLVVLGGHDHLCGTLGAGAFDQGSLFDVTGTWESLIFTTDRPMLEQRVGRSGLCVQSHVAQQRYAVWGGAPAGEALEWLARLFEQPGGGGDRNGGTGRLWDLLEETEGGQEVLFLPHLSAGGCPIDDPQSRGALVGLTGATGRADLVRAVVQAINFQFAHIIETMQQALGRSLESITVGGGASSNAYLMQHRADLLGMALQVCQDQQTTGRGAAMLAGVGAGLFDSLEQAAEQVCQPHRLVEPRADRFEPLARRFELYKQLYPALKELHHRLADLRDTGPAGP